MAYTVNKYHGRKKLEAISGGEVLLQGAIIAANQDLPYCGEVEGTVALLMRKDGILKILLGPATDENLTLVKEPNSFPTWWLMVTLRKAPSNTLQASL